MNESQIFIDALNVADPAERAAYLDAACAGNPETRAAVEALLRMQAKNPDFLEQPADPLTGTRDAAPDLPPTTAGDAERPGTLLAGKYKLLEEIGVGGMGTVWMAQQMEPIKRLVAVKLIKAGMDSKTVLARFEAERHALALMDHPHIAKVHDAGTTDTGRPFFVMELVRGVPLTKYCDAHHLTPRQRVELFVPICHAVQHAHQKGIIHRDLKPGNILVALYDGKPIPKVIDFGVAKAAGPQLTDHTLVTGFGTVVGTLEYMSPEQAEVNQLDIDTRSDIYSLGVLLYELLAGSPPFSRKELEKAGMLEMLRVIREQEPSKPSTKLSTAEGLPTLAANRGTEPAKLTKLVRGELDWIVMKALEKDRNRRYETANGFAMDVQRYLADEQVLACPPSVGYRFRKFARRNKSVLLAALSAVGVVVLGVAGLAGSNLMIRQEQARTRAANVGLKQNLRLALQALDETNVRLAQDHMAKDPKGRGKDEELLKSALAFYERFAEQNSDDPDVRHEMSRAYTMAGNIDSGLWQHARARQAHERAIEVAERLAAAYPKNPDYRRLLGQALLELTSALDQAGETGEAAKHAGRVFEIRKQLADEYPDVLAYRQDLAEAYNAVGEYFRRSGDSAAAVPRLRQAVDIHTRLGTEGLNTPLSRYQRARANVNLGVALYEMNDPEQVEHWRTAIPIYADLIAHEDQYGDLPVRERPILNRCRRDLATTHRNVGGYLKDKGDAGAEEHLVRSVALMTEVVTDVPNVARYRAELVDSVLDLGSVLFDSGRHKDAEAMYQQAVEHLTRLAADHSVQARYLQKLADAHEALGNLQGKVAGPAAAATQYRQAMSAYEKLTTLFPQAPHLNTFAWFLANCPDLALRDPGRAARLAQEAVKTTAQSSNNWNTLGIALYRNREWKAAVGALEESMGLSQGGDCCDWLVLAMAHWELGDKEQARKWYLQAVRALEQNKPHPHAEKEDVRRFRKEAEELLKIEAGNKKAKPK